MAWSSLWIHPSTSCNETACKIRKSANTIVDWRDKDTQIHWLVALSQFWKLENIIISSDQAEKSPSFLRRLCTLLLFHSMQVAVFGQRENIYSIHEQLEGLHTFINVLKFDYCYSTWFYSQHKTLMLVATVALVRPAIRDCLAVYLQDCKCEKRVALSIQSNRYQACKSKS